MSSAIEIEIQQLLKNIGEPALVADEMLKRWVRDELSDDDIERVAHFLIAFGFQAALAENLAVKLKDGFRVSWSAVGRLIETAKFKPDKDTVDQILIGASEQGDLKALARFPHLENVDNRFSKIRTQTLEDQRKRNSQLKDELLAQAEIFRNDRLADREREVLRRLLEMYPDDGVIRDRFSEFSTRWARERLDRSPVWLNQEERYWRQEAELSPELKKAATDIAKKLAKKVKKDKTLGYDVAIALYQMGQISEALEVLRLAPKSPATVWLEIELVIEAHRFVEVLGLIDRVEAELAHETDTIPAAMYARARALWGLHQYESAIDILESLIRVQPDYRSAHSLLTQWREAFA